MNVRKTVLLALTSAAIFVAAPISAQGKYLPGDVVSAPLAAVEPDHSAIEYALKVEAGPEAFCITGGIPSVAVGLMFGLEETHFMLPGNAMLRVEPLVIIVLGQFDDTGEYRVPLDGIKGQPQPHVELYIQAISVANEITKLCTSELIWVRTDLAKDWQFDYRG